MDSSIPFHQQLSSRFAILVSFFIIAIGLLSFLLYDREQQLSQLLDTQAPQMDRFYRQQTALNESLAVVNQIKLLKASGAIAQHHQKLIAQLQIIKSITLVNKRGLEQITSSLLEQDLSVNRLSENEARNELLKENSILQLQLILDEINLYHADLQAKQQKLYQQITTDKVTDRVTTSRAKAFASVTQELLKIEQTRAVISNVYVMMSRIQLQYSLEDFDYYAQQLSLLFEQWQPQFEAIAQAGENDKKLLDLLITLKSLLVDEQNTLAKWRGHIRVAQEYFFHVQALQPILQQRSEQLSRPEINLGYLPIILEKVIPHSGKFSINHYQLTVLGLLLLLTAGFLVSLYWIRRRIIQNSAQNVATVKLGLESSEGDQLSKSLEQTELLEVVRRIARPKYGEADYVALAQEVRRFHQLLSQQGSIAIFSSNPHALVEQSYVDGLLFCQHEKHFHWRHAFSLQTARMLLKAAREAKTNQVNMQVRVDALCGHSLFISATYEENSWHGVIANQAEYQALQQQADQQQQLFQQQLAKQLNEQTIYAQQLNQMVIRAKLQGQGALLANRESLTPLSRQLTRMFDWSKQLQLVGNIEALNHAKSIVTISLRDELAALVNNLLLEDNFHRNKVLVNLPAELVDQVQINISLFHQLLSLIAKNCMQETSQATLVLSVELLDKNAGQQIIGVSFSLYSEQSGVLIPDVLKMWSGVDDETKEVSLVACYFSALMQMLHGKDFQLVEYSDHYTVSFGLPIALSDGALKKAHTDNDLKEADIIVFSTNKLLSSQLSQSIQDFNGKVEVVEQTAHLIKQLSTKHLNKHALACLIVSPELIKQERRVIEQHLKSLPKAVRPKLLILQSHIATSLHKEGFYQHSDYFEDALSFIEQLSDYIQSEKNDNCLIPKEVFSHYQFEPNQVQVLIAVQQPQRYQHLARVLYAFGLQPHFVCQPETMLNQWCTGRYLVLFSEFKQSPFIDLQVGRNVARGVISLSQKFKSHKHFGHWKLGHLPQILDIENLVNLITPWLKEKVIAISHKTNAKTPHIDNTQREQHEIGVTKEVIEPPVEHENSMVTPVFDLVGYARNQGSPELAGFMLEDYILELEQAINGIELAIQKQDLTQINVENQQLLKISSILVAEELIALSKALTQAVEEESLDQALLHCQQIQIAFLQLTEFAKAI